MSDMWLRLPFVYDNGSIRIRVYMLKGIDNNITNMNHTSIGFWKSTIKEWDHTYNMSDNI